MNSSRNRWGGINPVVVKQIFYHARQARKHPALAHLEIEDIEQELMLEYLCMENAFNPALSSYETYTSRVLKYRCFELIALGKAGRTLTPVAEYSLEIHEEIQTDKNIVLESLWPATPSSESDANLALDVMRVWQKLTPVLQHYCVLLMQGMSGAEICRRCGRNPSSIYQALIRIRRLFAAHGLEKYFI